MTTPAAGFTPTLADLGLDSGPALQRGVMIDGVFWSVTTPITTAAITLRATQAKVRRAVTAVITFVAVLGCLLFIAGIAVSWQADVLTSKVWFTPSIFMVGFWLALLAACLLYYRRTAPNLDFRTLPKPKTLPELQTIPSLDLVDHHEDIWPLCDPAAQAVIVDAFSLANKAKHADVLPLHFFVAAISSPTVGILFARLGLNFKDITDPLRRRLATFVTGDTDFGGIASDLLARALMLALADNRQLVTPLEIFTAAYAVDEFVQDLLSSKGIELAELNNALTWLRITDSLRARYTTWRGAAASKPKGNMDRAYTAIATPFLDKVSEDLTHLAVLNRTEMLIGREREMAELLRAMESGQRSVVLVGLPGVGKSAIIEGLAERMAAEDVPQILQDKRLLKLSVPHIVSAEGGQGADERLLYALQEVGKTGNVILVIENLHELVTGTGLDLSSILSSELEKGYTLVVGTTTPAGYQQLEKSPLRQRLAKVVIDEPGRDDAIHVLESKTALIEGRNHVVFTYQALAAIVDLSTRYLHEDNLPEKAINLAKEVALQSGKGSSKGGQLVWVRAPDVAAMIAAKTGVPVTGVTQDEGEKLLHIEERIHERVVGQAAAVSAVSAALRRARVELRSSKRPIGNFLFLGPTGVGKTELAKATAEVFFGSDSNMLRFDMSEYQDKASVSRLIGGNGEAGLLTEAVRRQPFALLLLDELEKAHPDILNLFLQVMDDGRLTDGTGRTIDFTNVILIATSNAGTNYIQDALTRGDAIDAIKTALLETELRQIYKPEFLNRFDDVIVFQPLSPEDVVAIAYLMLKGVTDQMAAKGITLVIEDDAVHELAKLGYDPKFGARPLRRVIQEKVENSLANFLLQGQVGRRDKLHLTAGGQITVEKATEL